MSDRVKDKGKNGRVAKVDSMPTKELRRYARLMTRQYEDLQFRMKSIHKKRLADQEKIRRLLQEKEELEATLAGLQKQEEGDLSLRVVDVNQPRTARRTDSPADEKKTLSGHLHDQTPVSQTQLSIQMPSNLKLADWGNNASQESIQATPVDGAVKGSKLKSPAWESIKKKPRKAQRVDVPSPEQLGPRLEDDSFKYLEIIRKKDDRAKLPAGFCEECARFYRAYAEHGDLAKANELVKRLCGHSMHQLTSRHRKKYETPATPPDYWDILPIEPHS